MFVCQADTLALSCAQLWSARFMTVIQQRGAYRRVSARNYTPACSPGLEGRIHFRRVFNGTRAILHPVNAAARFGNDTFWSTAGNTVTQGLSFCSTLIIVRVLTKAEFGQYAVFLSSIALLGTLAGLGLGIAISTTTAELRDSAPAELGRKLGAAYRIGGAVTICLSALIVLAWATLGDGILQLRLEPLYLALVIATLGVNVASMLQASELVGYQNFRSQALAQCIRGISLLPLSAAGAVLFRLPGVISALVAATTMTVLVQASALARERKQRGIVTSRPSQGQLAAVLSCSASALVADVSQAAGYWVGNVTVASQSAIGLAAVAEFGAASQLRNIIMFFPNIIGQVLIPSLANMKATRAADSGRLVRLSLALNAALALLLAATIIGFRRHVALLFGSAYGHASATVALIGAGGVIYVVQSTISSALIGYGHIRWVALANILAAVAFISGAGALIRVMPELGSQCLGWAYILSSTVQLVTNSARLLAPRRNAGTRTAVEQTA